MPRFYTNDDAEPQLGLPPVLISGMFDDPCFLGIDKLTVPQCPGGLSSSFVDTTADKLRLLEKGVNATLAVVGTLTHDWSQDTQDEIPFDINEGFSPPHYCISKVTGYRSEAVADGSFEFDFSVPGDGSDSGQLCLCNTCAAAGWTDTPEIATIPFNTASNVSSTIAVHVTLHEEISACRTTCRSPVADVDTTSNPAVTISCSLGPLQIRMCYSTITPKISILGAFTVTASGAYPSSDPISKGWVITVFVYSGTWPGLTGGDWLGGAAGCTDPTDLSSPIDVGSVLGVALHARWCATLIGADSNMNLSTETGTHPTCDSMTGYDKLDRTGTIKLAFTSVTFADY